MCTDFDAVLAIEKNNCCVGHIKCSYRTANEVVRTRTVYNIKLLLFHFYVENGRENGVTILLFNREIIANCVFAATDPRRFITPLSKSIASNESGFPRARTSQQGNVLNFISSDILS